MNSTLLGTGLACVIAAIVGGGLKAFGIDVPVLQSGKRQLLLATFGMIVLATAYATWEPAHPPGVSTPSGKSTPTAAEVPNRQTPTVQHGAVSLAYQLGKTVGWLSFYQTERASTDEPTKDEQQMLTGKHAILKATLDQLDIHVDGASLDFVGTPGTDYELSDGSCFLKTSLNSKHSAMVSKAFELGLKLQNAISLTQRKAFSSLIADLRAQGVVHILNEAAKEFGVAPVSTNAFAEATDGNYNTWVQDRAFQLDAMITQTLE